MQTPRSSFSRLALRQLAALALTGALIGTPAYAAPTEATVLTHYAELVEANYLDTLAAARDLQRAIDDFVANPSEARLSAARKAWLEAREWYGQSEAFRFYGGPIDGDEGPEGLINAWPLDEGYVDYVEGNPKAGIINDQNEDITPELLA